MIKTVRRELVVGLDIGASEIITLVGEILNDGTVQVLGLGRCPSRGIDKDGVNDIELVEKCVRGSISQAESMADCRIASVYLSLSGRKISCQNEAGMVSIHGEVNQSDIENVIHTARAVRMPEEQRILHVIPQEYTVDNQQGIKNPIGFTGMRMQAKVHLITCHNDMAKNVLRAVERCGLGVDQLVYSGLASCLAVSSEEDRRSGVCVVDIGSSTIDIAIYTDGALRHVKVIPYAGNTITNDIAYLFSTSSIEAESIKVSHGALLETVTNGVEDIIVNSVNGESSDNISNQELSKVIEPRYTELLEMVNIEIQQIQSQLQSKEVNYYLDAGVILTGGSAQISGLATLGSRVFQMPVRIGQPLNTVGLPDDLPRACFSTSIGLLHYGKELRLSDDPGVGSSLSMRGIFRRISNWLKKEF